MVINSTEIKSNALNSIKNSSPSPIIATTMIILFASVVSAIQEVANEKQIGLLLVLGVILSLIYSFICVGYSWYCLNVARNQSPDPLSMFEIFTSERFGKVIKLWLLIYVKILLWSLLFVIPGIIKSYSYSQSLYILYDNPSWTASQCIKESQEMMKGNKLELFVFQISFIGWAILTTIALVIINLILGLFLPSFIAVIISTLAMIPLYLYMCVSLAGFYNALYIARYNQY